MAGNAPDTMPVTSAMPANSRSIVPVHQQGEEQSNEGKQQVLAHKLAYELGAAGSDDLLDTDLLEPVLRAGGGQIDEIDAGDEQDDPGHDGKDGHIGDEPAAVGGVEVNLIHGLEVQGLAGVSLRFAVVVGLRDLGIHLQKVGVFPELDIRLAHVLPSPIVRDSARAYIGNQEIELDGGILRKTADHSGYLEGHPVVDPDDLAHGLFAAYQFLRQFFRDDDGAGIVQGGGGVSGQQRERKHAEKAGIDPQAPADEGLPAMRQLALRLSQVGRQHDLGIFGLEQAGDEPDHHRVVPAAILAPQDEPVQVVEVFVEPVVGLLVPDPDQDKDAHGHAHGQPGEVDERVDLLPPDVSPGDLEGGPEHGPGPVQPHGNGRCERPYDLEPVPSPGIQAAPGGCQVVSVLLDVTGYGFGVVSRQDPPQDLFPPTGRFRGLLIHSTSPRISPRRKFSHMVSCSCFKDLSASTPSAVAR